MMKRLINEMKQKNSAIVVGLDPYLDKMPKDILERSYQRYGETMEGAAHAILDFNKKVIDEIYDLVVGVKPQIAFYELYGTAGIEAYIKTIQYAKQKGLIVIGDCKRGDIGSTSMAYAKAHIGKTKIEKHFYPSFDEDFVTVNPYLGSDGIEPFVEMCKKDNKGIFVLVKTSNPSSSELQNLVCQDGEIIYLKVAKLVKSFQTETKGYDAIGCVVGATYPQEAKAIRKILPNAFFLVPGYGTQGADGSMIQSCYNEDGFGALVSASRSILYSENIRQATIEMRDDINKNRQRIG